MIYVHQFSFSVACLWHHMRPLQGTVTRVEYPKHGRSTLHARQTDKQPLPVQSGCSIWRPPPPTADRTTPATSICRGGGQAAPPSPARCHAHSASRPVLAAAGHKNRPPDRCRRAVLPTHAPRAASRAADAPERETDQWAPPQQGSVCVLLGFLTGATAQRRLSSALTGLFSA